MALSRCVTNEDIGFPCSRCTQGEGGGKGSRRNGERTLSPTLSLSTRRGSQAHARRNALSFNTLSPPRVAFPKPYFSTTCALLWPIQDRSSILRGDNVRLS